MLLLVVWFLLSGSSKALAASAADGPQSVVAEVEGEKITAEQLEKTITVELTDLQDQIYDLKRQKLETMINDRLLAKEATRQKSSVAELLDKEVTAKITLVTEQEVDAFYQANKEKIKDGPQVRQQIRQYLQNQRLNAERDAAVQGRRKGACHYHQV